MQIAVIVTTYQWPDALSASLDSLAAQDDSGFEVIVAEDGEDPRNEAVVRHWQARFGPRLRHVRHEDRGFRAGTIRNAAVAATRADYVIFLDGDCLVRPDFVRRHRALAEEGYFVPGNRVLVSESFTPRAITLSPSIAGYAWWRLLGLRLLGRLNRFLPLLPLALGTLRKRHPRRWQKAMTCNLAVWRRDLLTVDGFDERYEGWGYEDSDLVIRLIHAGVRRKEGRFAVPVLHLWHRQNPRDQANENLRRLMARVDDPTFVKAERGLSQHAGGTP